METLLAISAGSIGIILIYSLIGVIILSAIWWFTDWVGVKQPLNKGIKIVLVVIGFIILINLLLSLVGRAFITW